MAHPNSINPEKTKLFFRAWTMVLLEGLRTRMLLEQERRREHAALEVQCVYRGLDGMEICLRVAVLIASSCTSGWLVTSVEIWGAKRRSCQHFSLTSHITPRHTGDPKHSPDSAHGISKGQDKHGTFSLYPTYQSRPRASLVSSSISRTNYAAAEMATAMLNFLHPTPPRPLEPFLGGMPVPSTPNRNNQSPTASSSFRPLSWPPSRTRAQSRSNTSPTLSKTSRLKKLAFYRHGQSKSVDTSRQPDHNQGGDEDDDVSTPLPELKIYNQFMRKRGRGT
ncbi:hypothetical protein K435DRAFT_972107 [Dendrothele bispora CBS 962.96]|uniref:Uncharacterized protein n=1 Tax=Dendrothele bispora (strain CBS 962.96) TaxID=1314807 RepID=A0A4S8L1A5_DENBC|nr:hypothetical protein K435DRAFT_972107 [Dendrothele bispora CBS 962.96]